MNVLVIGGSRGIGQQTVRTLAQVGHVPLVLARSRYDSNSARVSPDDWFSGDARDHGIVSKAIERAEVVIVTLGISHSELFRSVSLFSEATRVVIEEMNRLGKSRLIIVTGFGAGRSLQRIAAWQRLPFELLFGRAYRDKDIQERLVTESGLDWTIVRPGVLTNGSRTDRYKVLTDMTTWRNGAISRKDVAAFLVAEVSEPTGARRDVVLVG